MVPEQKLVIMLLEKSTREQFLSEERMCMCFYRCTHFFLQVEVKILFPSSTVLVRLDNQQVQNGQRFCSPFISSPTNSTPLPLWTTTSKLEARMSLSRGTKQRKARCSFIMVIMGT